MALKLVTPLSVEPITLEAAKMFLRVDSDSEDSIIGTLISAARQFVENPVTNRALVTQTWDMFLDGFPAENYIKIPKPPLQSVESFSYTDIDGMETVWDSSNYLVDTVSEPGRIVLAPGKSWPQVNLYPVNPVKVRFKAGYDSVPKPLEQAMYMLIAHWYENREAVLTGKISKEIEFAVNALCQTYRIFPF